MDHLFKQSFITVFFLFLLTACIAQTPVKNYESDWKRVEELATKKNLPKSALAEVVKIYKMAKRDKQDAQVIKALVYMVNLQSENREENEILGINEIEKEISISKEPAASILKNLLAGVYWNYFQRFRWQLYNRTQTKDFNKDDIATWTAEDLHKKISDLYLSSISNEKLLQQTKLQPFDAIIIKGSSRNLRPTLFDLLARHALDYFRNPERDIKKPAYAFEINQEQAFSSATEFATFPFITNDSLSLHHKALLIYQQLLKFHLKDNNPEALIDADIDRIQFIKQHGVMNHKDSLYKKALERITETYPGNSTAAQAWYLLARIYEEQASTFQPFGDTTHRYDRLKAKEICEKVLATKKESEGWVNCYNLLVDINKKEFSFQVEKINVPSDPFRMLLNYRNINQLHFRLIKPDEKLKNAIERFDETFWSKVLAATFIRNWQQKIPATHDLQQHAVELKVDALPTGEYILLAATESNFNESTAILGARLFYVSNISFVNNQQDHFVLHRQTGLPLSNANIQVWEQRYDYQTSRYEKEKGSTYKADANGYFRIAERKNEKRSPNFLLDISYNSDRLFMSEFMYDHYYSNRFDNTLSDEDKTKTFFFTDRSIYRPAQTIFFKGIVITLENNPRNHRIKPDFSTVVYMNNANHEIVDSLKVTTNEFGSFSGKFQLPTGVLNGQFYIYTKRAQGQQSFRVEEYKRPKFFVEYEKIKSAYKVNDKIKVTGVAKAYAGNNIDGATVSYRVVRQPRFIYPWLFWRMWLPPAEPMEIAHGLVKTDKDGKFIVEFTAIPDLKIDKKLDPVFDYRIYADVTDINGETRSGETLISAGYKSLLLKVNLTPTLTVDSLRSISIRTENMNEEFEPAQLKVSIFTLIPEKRLIRNRYWQRPDQYVMPREEFLKFFPNDEYFNETDFKSWDKGRVVYEATDSSRLNGQWPIDNRKLAPGFYVVEIETKDKDGNLVKDIKYIELIDVTSRQLNRLQYLWTHTSGKPIEPGESATINIGSSADVFVVRQVDKQLPITNGTAESKEQILKEYNYLRLNNEKKKFDFSATEADRGGYGVQFFFIKHNRFYQFGDIIQVPWTNKELKIEYATFRDKTLPGSEEKWKLKITGYKNEKFAAEMLASLYDASLDQFVEHNWYQPTIWPFYVQRSFWNGALNFSHVESQLKWVSQKELKHFDKTYDRLIGSHYELVFMSRRTGVFNQGGIAKDEQISAAAPPGQLNGVLAEASKTSSQSDTNASITRDAISKPITENIQTQIRRNFNETAFFFPDLRTDSSGAIEFSFTIPEALTKWKFQSFTHTKELALGLSKNEIITQKQLMVQPNMPRFLREGDRMEFSTKIVNLTQKEMTGQAGLQLFDASTNQPVDGWFHNSIPNQYFTVAAGESEVIQFPLQVPYNFNKALTWRFVATSTPSAGSVEGIFSDGEEASLPVLTNRMLVTETLPIPMRNAGTKTFKFEKLLNTSNVKGNQESTLQHHALTVEYTANPAWYAVQALPYIMEYPYDCAEQIWNRYYANALASKIANSAPRIRQIIEQWKIKDTSALLSNLQKNQELKAVLLEETPWVLQAKSEEQQKKNIALLFDMVKMNSELQASLEKLKQLQSPNGGFVWFKGGPDDRYMTQYIITGIGHLKKLNIEIQSLNSILKTAIPYLDRKIKEDYDNLVKHKADLKKQNVGYMEIQYLYMRSFFAENKIPQASQTAYNYFRKQSQQFWMKQNKYMQGMIALELSRTGDKKTPAMILASLKETSITNEELGMYWKDMNNGWFWYQAPIETQALLIEAFREISNDLQTVDDLRTWLLKNKQTNNWRTTKATAEACYALLLQGTQWITEEPVVTIQLGNINFVSTTTTAGEAGTGYLKKAIDGQFVKSEMGNISVTVASATNNVEKVGASWGAVYWQYFENLDKITTASTPLKLVKKLFIEKNTDRGPVLSPVKDGDLIKVGDKIKVRIELRVDREMEYVHMKDMRASALEPVNVLSGYKWQGGLGYYETTRDASTNFFFNYLRRGTYVFEYPLFVTHAGNFSNGITSIQCMYAPEFSSHSEGIRITIEK